jgi:hypothetical protein
VRKLSVTSLRMTLRLTGMQIQVFSEESKLYLVMDLATGGDAFDRYCAAPALFRLESNAAAIILKVY